MPLRLPRLPAVLAVVALLSLAAPTPAAGSGTDTQVSSRVYQRSGAQVVAFTRAADPARSIVTDRGGAWIATFTDGARTVSLAGPVRRFDEATATHAVTTGTWVRLLPAPFDGTVDAAWLSAARQDRTPDVLALAMQYLSGAPDLRGADGLLVAGAADYGPLRDGDRPPGSDWNDYQGVIARYPGGRVDHPEPDRYRSLDCSGYVRMLFGRRLGLPLGLGTDGGASLPRTARAQADSAPGTVVMADTGRQVTRFDALAPGDLVFFDAAFDGVIDHVGVYLGADDGRRHRFVSSRRSVNGPTMGDRNGWSVLDGSGLFARSFRAARRL